MIKLKLKTISPDKHRYETSGDYWTGENGVIQVRVSKMRDERFEWFVAIHEMAELFLCRAEGVRFEDVDAFDIAFEADRLKGLHGHNDEPGDDPKAPYYKQHQTATKIEKMLCEHLNVAWDDYEEYIYNDLGSV